MRFERIPRTDANAGINFREPVSKAFTVTLSTRYEYGNLDNEVNTYNKFGGTLYDKINPVLSSDFTRESHRSNNSMGVEYKYKKLVITPTIRGLWQKVDNKAGSLPAIRQNRFDVLPGLSLVLGKLNVYYDKGVVLPAYNYLTPVLNNTNPYYVVNGNPTLLPAKEITFQEIIILTIQRKT